MLRRRSRSARGAEDTKGTPQGGEGGDICGWECTLDGTVIEAPGKAECGPCAPCTLLDGGEQHPFLQPVSSHGRRRPRRRRFGTKRIPDTEEGRAANSRPIVEDASGKARR